MQVANVTNLFVTNTAFQSYVANTNSRFLTITGGQQVSNTYFQAYVANNNLNLANNYVTNTAFQAYVANTNALIGGVTVTNTDFQAYVANTNTYIATKANESTFQSALANTNSWITGLDATLVANTYFNAYFSNATLSSVASVTFEENQDVTSTSSKQLRWDYDNKTASLGLENGTVLQLGQEQYTLVRNATGSTINNGTVLYQTGSSSVSGDTYKLTAAPYTSNGLIDPSKFVGLATSDFDNGLIGYATTFGYVRDLDTRGSVSNTVTDGTESWSAGDSLYAHPSSAGKLTNQKPKDPTNIGYVVSVGQTDGVLFVNPVIQSPDQVHATFTVTANGTTGYCFAGSGAANTNNETLYLYKGFTYKFNNTTGASHPFQILNTAGGSAFSNGVSGSQSAVQYFTVPHAQQSNLVYQCSIHSGMQGTLVIVS
jgi:hypothetical protein